MSGTFWNTDLGNPELSLAEIALRDRFCDQYVIDYDEVKACMRIGYHKQFAVDYAKKFMEEPYVQKRIQELSVAPSENEQDEEQDTKRLIRSQLLKEAAYVGPGSSQSARVAALSKLMAMYDMESPKKIEAEITNRGGVMAVPGVCSIEEWQKVAAAQQAELAKAADV